MMIVQKFAMFPEWLDESSEDPG